MAWIGLITAWMAAALWLGAANVRLLPAPGDGTVQHDEAEFSAAMQSMRRWLRHAVMGAALVMLAGIVLNVAARGSASPTQGASSIVVLIAVLSLMFHVEHAKPFARIIHGQRIRDFILFILGAAVFILATADLVAGARANYPLALRWIVLLTCGALGGTALASVMIMPLIRNFSSTEIDQRFIRLSSRWTFLSVGLAIMAASAGIEMLWAARHPALVLRIIATCLCVVPILLIAATWITCQRFERFLALMPILGDGERTLRARHTDLRRTARRVVWMGSAGALAALLLAVGLASIIISPPRSARRSQVKTVGMPHTSLPTPTVTPASGANGLDLTQSAGGAEISLTSGPLATGNNIAHVSLTNSQGQPVTNGIVTLVISPMLISAGSATIQATADPSGKQGSFVATLNFTQPGIWQVVVLVATADQSIMTSVVFSVEVK